MPLGQHPITAPGDPRRSARQNPNSSRTGDEKLPDLADVRMSVDNAHLRQGRIVGDALVEI